MNRIFFTLSLSIRLSLQIVQAQNSFSDARPSPGSSTNFTANPDQSRHDASGFHETDISLSLYPNPASDYVKLTVIASVAEEATIQLRDNIGNKVLDLTVGLNPGQNQVTIDLNSPKIKSGMHFLKLETLSGVYTKKLIVKK